MPSLYNTDEIGLYFRALPNKTLGLKLRYAVEANYQRKGLLLLKKPKPFYDNISSFI